MSKPKSSSARGPSKLRTQHASPKKSRSPAPAKKTKASERAARAAPVKKTQKHPVRRPPAPKTGIATSPPMGARTAPPTKRPGLRPTAGPLVLRDLGLTDEALAAFLPSAAPESALVRGVLWCQFDRAGSLGDLADHFAANDRYEVTRGTSEKFPDENSAFAISVPTVTLTPPGAYVAYTFYGMRGERHVEDGRWQLETTFRSMGTPWGSNRAVHERFKAIELKALGAEAIEELTE